MRAQLLGLVAEQCTDRDAYELMHRLNSSVLQAGLLGRLRAVGDNSLELSRRIQSMGRDGTLSSHFVDVRNRIRALPEPYQHAPLEALFQQCMQGPLSPDPKQLCMLAALAASRPIEKYEKFGIALLTLTHRLSTSSSRGFFHYLLLALKDVQKDDQAKAFEHSATFLRVLAYLVSEKPPQFLMNALEPQEEITLLMALKNPKLGQAQDKLTVLPYFLGMALLPKRLHHDIVFDVLKSLPLKQCDHHLVARVMGALCAGISNMSSSVQSELAHECFKVIGELDPDKREHSLCVVLNAGDVAGNYDGIVRKCFAALSELHKHVMTHMIMRVIYRVPEFQVHGICQQFVRYVKTEKPADAKKVLERVQQDTMKLGQQLGRAKVGIVAGVIRKALDALKA